ncbi:hypothetical protein IHE44_0005630, partial [Lamprotornis superbus]
GSLSPLLSLLLLLLLLLLRPSPQLWGAKRSFLVALWCWEARRVLQLTQAARSRANTGRRGAGERQGWTTSPISPGIRSTGCVRC